MAVHKISKGMNLPIAGWPLQVIEDAPTPTEVALMGDDYHGMRPRMYVEEGQTVKRGQVLFEDRKTPGVRHTAPAAGVVKAINRGHRRVLQSVVIRLSDGERAGSPGSDEFQPFESYAGGDPESWTREQLRDLLVESGFWSAFRTRPFSKVPAPDSLPDAVFVNAMDTHPLAARPGIVIRERRDDFQLGLRLIAGLTEGTTYLSVEAGSDIAEGLDAPVQVEQFEGPHPAGTAGVHIHTLFPVGRKRTVWTIHYQDVLSLARLATSGKLSVERVVAMGGPSVRQPRVLRTRMGVSLDDITANEILEGDHRTISGSVLSGKKAAGPVFGFLSRYDLQVTALEEGHERQFLLDPRNGWAGPCTNAFSVLPLLALGRFMPAIKGGGLSLTTTTNGSKRAMVPIGLYEKVFPMDMIPTYLLRSLAVGDTDQAEALGALELDEEDVALCTFVDPGKVEYGPILRKNLQIIDEEG